MYERVSGTRPKVVCKVKACFDELKMFLSPEYIEYREERERVVTEMHKDQYRHIKVYISEMYNQAMK